MNSNVIQYSLFISMCNTVSENIIPCKNNTIKFLRREILSRSRCIAHRRQDRFKNPSLIHLFPFEIHYYSESWGV